MNGQLKISVFQLASINNHQCKYVYWKFCVIVPEVWLRHHKKERDGTHNNGTWQENHTGHVKLR